MVRANTGLVGRGAEQRVFRYLRRHGLTPVARNFRCRRGEIDLVMLDQACLVFVEVRFRGRNSIVNPALTVDARKQRKLAQTALVFLAKNPDFRHHVCRFDVVGVGYDASRRLSVDWIRDAFRPGA